jgi:hypothetical protein
VRDILTAMTMDVRAKFAEYDTIIRMLTAKLEEFCR